MMIVKIKKQNVKKGMSSKEKLSLNIKKTVQKQLNLDINHLKKINLMWIVLKKIRKNS